MKNSRMKICGILLLAVLGVTGCGDKLTTLTPDQENMVVSYSAHIISKYNKNQTDGIADMGSDTETTKSSEQTKAQSQKPQTASAMTSGKDVEKSTQQTQTQKSVQPDTSKQTSTQTAASTQATTQPALEQKALGDALGITPMTAAVTSYGIETQITDQNFTFTLSPQAGTQSLVLHVDLTNTGNQDANCDIVSKNASFSVLINGTLEVGAENSNLKSDLSAYNQTIKAGATNKAVLIFSVPQENATNMQSLELVTKVNDVSSATKIL